jgi:type IV pilus assembly protein PilQ
MRWERQQLGAVCDRAVRRLVPGCAVLGGALLLLLLTTPSFSWAQGSNSDRLFEGVRRGTETPELIASQPIALRQPGDLGGDAYQPIHDSKVNPAAAEVETLPSPSNSVPTSQARSSSTRVEGTLPLAGWDSDVDMAQGHNGRIERLVVRDASLSKVLSLLAQTYHLNVVAANDIDAVISITLRDVALEEALTAILSVANYTWVQRDSIILVTSLTDAGNLAPEVQGRSIQIFELDFVSAVVVSEAVSAFLSPIGKMSVATSDPTDSRRTREMIIVEDIPEAVARIGSYIEQVDCPPRQVLIEAHIFQVTLRDNQKEGVNFNALFRVAGAKVNIISIPSLAAVPLPQPGNPVTNPSVPAALATINGHDLQAGIDLLQKTTDTKTLGSPKVLVLNQQEARIHVGEDLGYQTTVTSELQSTQAPQFLQVGVLLTITPRITRDNRVLLTVHPEVSTGAIDPNTQVPNKRTTELDTDVMLRDGEGMIIGGLIDEQDHIAQTKIPYLGDLWRAGFLFRSSDVLKERKEVIIAIVPRIQPYSSDYQNFEQGELIRAQTPLYQGPLCYTDRPFDTHLPDGKRVARPYIPPRAILPEVNRTPCNHCEAPWPQYYVPPKPLPQQHLSDDSIDPALEYSDGWDQHAAQPEMAGEYLPEPSGPQFSDDSIISDQP